MAFNKWAKQLPPKKEEVDTSSLMMQNQQRSDLAAIQDKINKALQNIDDIYDEPSSGDPLVREIEDEIRMMENGPLKVKLSTFLQRYQMQEARVQQVDDERSEVLGQLSEWFEMDHMGDFDLDNSSAMTEVKFEFTKLQQLNQEMKSISAGQDGFEEMKKERIRLQTMAVDSFKRAQEDARRAKMTQEMDTSEREGESLWKHAADEVVEMMGKIRTEGKEYIVTLERKVRQMAENAATQTQKVKRLQNILEEKKKLEKKWKSENSVLTKEKSTLIGKCRKMKKELMETRKAIGRHQPILPNNLESSSTELVDVNEESSELLMTARLANLKREHEALKTEMEKSIEKVALLENQLEEKEDQLFNLEHDKQELLHQMKQASVRPDIRQMSDSSPRISAISLTMASTHSIRLEKEQRKGTPTQQPSGKCSDCGKKITDESEEPKNVTKKTIKKAATKSQGEVSKREEVEKEKEILQKEVLELNQHIGKLENQLATAHQDLINIKLNQAPTQQPYPTPVPTADVHVNSMEIIPVSTSRSYNLPVHSDKLVITREEEEPRPIFLTHATKDSPVEITEEELVVSGTITDSRKETPVKRPESSASHGPTVNRGVQTDPKLDPLSEWAQPIAAEKGWRPPLPPPGWMDYDPTLDEKETYTFKKAMLKGAQPSEIKHEADHAALFIQKQLSRVVQGITGFRDYIRTMADNETRKMAAANDKLKSFLSQDEASSIDDKYNRKLPPSVLAAYVDMDQISTTPTQQHKTRRSSRMGFKKLGAVDSTLSSDEGYLDELQLTLSADEKVKMNVGIVAEKAVSMLEEAMKLLQDSLNMEYEQYENIYTTLQKRESGFQYMFDDDEDEEPEIPPELKRSFSHGDLEELKKQEETEQTVQKGVLGYGLLLNAPVSLQRSHSDILIRRDSTEKGMSIDRSVNPSRKEFHVAQATIPRKGQIEISTNQPINSMREFDIGQIRVKRKTKPMPVNHQKLKNRQKNLLQKDKVIKKPVTKILGGRERAFQPPAPAADQETPVLTMGDIENNLDMIKETTITSGHMKSIEQSVDYRNESVLPPISNPPGALRKLPPPSPNIRFPPIH